VRHVAAVTGCHQYFQPAVGQQHALVNIKTLQQIYKYRLGMGKARFLPCSPGPDFEQVGFLNTILLVSKRCVQGANSKRVRPGRSMDIRPDGSAECPQRLVVQVIHEVPEQTQIKTSAFWKVKRPFQVRNKLCLVDFTRLHFQQRV